MSGISIFLIPGTAPQARAVCTSSTRPPTPFAGQEIFETDTGRTLTYNGSAWVYVEGVVFCTSSTRPAAPFAGQEIFETDTLLFKIYQASTATWVSIHPASQVPSVRAVLTSQSISHATETTLSFTSETWDTHSMHNNSTNNSRITIPSGFDGRWMLSCRVQWASGSAGIRHAAFRSNGSTKFGDVQQAGVDLSSMNFVDVVNLSASDYVEVRVYQTIGTSLNVAPATFNATYLGSA